jgi:hypothetical protein
MNGFNIDLIRDNGSQVVITATPVFNTDVHDPIFVGCYQLVIDGKDVGTVCFDLNDTTNGNIWVTCFQKRKCKGLYCLFRRT